MGYEIYLISLTLTILSYGLGPVIFAFFTERVVSKRKLMLFSVVYTFLIWMAWVLVSYALIQDGIVETNTGSAFLWGIIFYWIAKKRMRSEGRIWERPRQEEPKGPATEEGLKALTHLSDKKEQANSNKIVPMKQDMNDSKPDEHTSSLELLAQLRDECEEKEEKNKNELSKKRSPGIALKVFCALLVVVCFSLGFICFNLEMKIQEIEKSIEQKDKSIEDYQNKLNYLEDRAQYYMDQNNLYAMELDFWESSAVIITETGSKYHTYGCQYVNYDSFMIYNVAAAVAYGYEPCSVCNPPY